MQIQQQQPHSKHTRIISTTNAFTAHIRSFPHQTCIQTTFYFLKRKKSNFFRIIHFGLSIAFENGEQRKKTALRVKQSWIRDSVTIYPTPNCAFPLEILLPFLRCFAFFLNHSFLQPPQVNGGGHGNGAMFDSYNFGHTVSPEVGKAVTPGDSPKAEEAFATFEEHSPFGAPASPQPKVI